MSIVESLPPGPLSERHLFDLNDADALEMAVPVGEDDERAHGVILATEAWLKGLAFDGDAWRVVSTYDLTEGKRIDALQDAEADVEAALDGDRPTGFGE
jgi:hypothetical protein